jgi:hypothetical protein
MESPCKRIDFTCLDGEDIFNQTKNFGKYLYHIAFYAKLANEEFCNITTAQMIKTFGPGELRPLEHRDDVFVWRFQYQDENGNKTILRVITPKDADSPAKYTNIEVEGPEGQESGANPINRANAPAFLAWLHAQTGPK